MEIKKNINLVIDKENSGNNQKYFDELQQYLKYLISSRIVDYSCKKKNLFIY